MIGEGAWPRDLQYISCDDYDGKNTPPRNGLDLKKYLTKVLASSKNVFFY